VITTKVRIPVDSKRKKEVMEILQSILEPTRVANGNVSCSLSEDCENRNVILYEEIWENETHLKHHMRVFYDFRNSGHGIYRGSS
jgi:quinol monooxygenase YgiN